LDVETPLTTIEEPSGNCVPMPDTNWVISVRRPVFAVVPAPGIGVGDADAPPLPALPLGLLPFPAVLAGALPPVETAGLPTDSLIPEVLGLLLAI
jgi:hypothetical protein